MPSSWRSPWSSSSSQGPISPSSPRTPWSEAAPGGGRPLCPTYLLVLIAGLHGARRLLMRRKDRRSLDAITGAVLLGFSAKLATEHI